MPAWASRKFRSKQYCIPASTHAHAQHKCDGSSLRSLAVHLRIVGWNCNAGSVKLDMQNKVLPQNPQLW